MELHHGYEQAALLGKLQDEIFLLAVGGLHALRPLIEGDAIFVVDDPLAGNEAGAPVAGGPVLHTAPRDGDARQFKIGHDGDFGVAVDEALAQYALAGLEAVDPPPLKVAFGLGDDLYPKTLFY